MNSKNYTSLAILIFSFTSIRSSPTKSNKVNAKYLATKRNKLGHLLDLVGEDLIEGNEK